MKAKHLDWKEIPLEKHPLEGLVVKVYAVELLTVVEAGFDPLYLTEIMLEFSDGRKVLISGDGYEVDGLVIDPNGGNTIMRRNRTLEWT